MRADSQGRTPWSGHARLQRARYRAQQCRCIEEIPEGPDEPRKVGLPEFEQSRGAKRAPGPAEGRILIFEFAESDPFRVEDLRGAIAVRVNESVRQNDLNFKSQ